MYVILDFEQMPADDNIYSYLHWYRKKWHNCISVRMRWITVMSTDFRFQISDFIVIVQTLRNGVVLTTHSAK